MQNQVPIATQLRIAYHVKQTISVGLPISQLMDRKRRRMKSLITTTLLFLQSLSLIALGCFTLWYSQPLTFWLISIIGEERALGKDSVVRLDTGEVLLTNPGAMGVWVLPFLVVGCIQISSGVMLLYYSSNRNNTKTSCAKTS